MMPKKRTLLNRHLERAKEKGKPVPEAEIPALKRRLGERANRGLGSARKRVARGLPERFKGIEEKVGRAGVLTPMTLSIIRSEGFELSRGVQFREKEGRNRGPLYAGIPEIREKAIAFHYYFRSLAEAAPENRLIELEVSISANGAIDIDAFKGALREEGEKRRFEYGLPRPKLAGEELRAMKADKLIEAFRKGTKLWL